MGGLGRDQEMMVLHNGEDVVPSPTEAFGTDSCIFTDLTRSHDLMNGFGRKLCLVPGS